MTFRGCNASRDGAASVTLMAIDRLLHAGARRSTQHLYMAFNYGLPPSMGVDAVQAS